MYAVIAQPARDFLNLGSRIETPFAQATPKLFRSKLLSQSCSNKCNQFLTRNHGVKSKDGFISLKCKPSLRVRAPFVLGSNRRVMKLSAFKSNGQNDDSGGRANGSKSLKNPIPLSYSPQDGEATKVESPKAQSFPASFPSEAESSYSLAIQNLFKSWLRLLRVPSANKTVDETLERPSSIGTSDTCNSIQPKENVSLVRAVCCYCINLDATVKIPILTFIPLYLAVYFMHGVEVSKDLTPLWVFGPLIAALYVKVLKRVIALYVFSFKLTVHVVRNLPNYCCVAYDYVFGGKIKEELRLRLVQPLVDIKNLDYKEISRRKIEELRVELNERYLDYVESIWPYYCRMIRVLKRAKIL